MKKTLMMFIAASLLSVMVVSCKSDADKLRDFTEEFNKITEKCENDPSITELRSMALKLQKLGDEETPDFIKGLSDEELLAMEGGPELLEAIAKATETLSKAIINAGAEQFETIGNMMNSIKEMTSDNEEDVNTDNSTEEYILYKGQIDEYPITMYLDIRDEENITGYYFYDEKTAIKYKLSGTYKDYELQLTSKNEDDELEGHFLGATDGKCFSGDFYLPNGQTQSFSICEE